MGEVNTNGYSVHDDLQISALVGAILAGITTSIFVLSALIGLGWLGITVFFCESVPDRLQEPFVFGCVIGAARGRGAVKVE